MVDSTFDGASGRGLSGLLRDDPARSPTATLRPCGSLFLIRLHGSRPAARLWRDSAIHEVGEWPRPVHVDRAPVARVEVAGNRGAGVAILVPSLVPDPPGLIALLPPGACMGALRGGCIEVKGGPGLVIPIEPECVLMTDVAVTDLASFDHCTIHADLMMHVRGRSAARPLQIRPPSGIPTGNTSLELCLLGVTGDPTTACRPVHPQTVYEGGSAVLSVVANAQPLPDEQVALQISGLLTQGCIAAGERKPQGPRQSSKRVVRSQGRRHGREQSSANKALELWEVGGGLALNRPLGPAQGA